MEEDIRWANKRAHPRISWNFIVRFRLHNNERPQGWEVSVIRNISLGGCYFYSNIRYEIGQILDIEVQFPSLLEPMKFVGEVKRYEENLDASVHIYGVAIQFQGMDEKKKNTFIETVNFFLKKQSKLKG